MLTNIGKTEKLPQHVSTQVKRWGKFKVPDLLSEESWRINFPLAAPLNYQVEVHHHNILKLKEDDFQKSWMKFTDRSFEPPLYLFPLHRQPEMSTSNLGGEFSDQVLAIETLSQWVPENHTIVVKEHPNQGSMMRQPLFFKRIEAMDNVVYCTDNPDTDRLRTEAMCVATI